MADQPKDETHQKDGVHTSQVPLSDLSGEQSRQQLYNSNSNNSLQQPAQVAYGATHSTASSMRRANDPYLQVDTNSANRNNPYGQYSSNEFLSQDVEKNAAGTPVEESLDGQHNTHQRTRSMRSFFSSRSRGSGRRSHENINQNTQYQQQHPNDTASSQDDDQKLLPTLEEQEEEEEVQDISEVMEELKEDETSGGGKRRGYNRLSRKKKGPRKPNKIIQALRDIYIKLLSRTLFTRSLVYWFPLALILFIPLAVGAWGSHHDAEIGETRIEWIFIWLEIVWAALWVSRFIAHLAPHIYEFLVGIVAPSLKKWSTVLVAVEIALSLVFWALISMCTFMPIMTQREAHAERDEKTQEWQSVVQNILVALLISSLVYLAERLMIHFLSVSFHKTRFAKRIKDNKLAIKILSQLLGAAYTVFPQFSPEFENDDLALEAGALLNKGKQIPVGFARKIVTSNNVQQVVGNLNRVVGGAAKVLGNVGRDIRGDMNGSNDAYNTVIDSLANRHLAETLARRIWMSLVLEDADELTIDDLIDVLGEASRADAEAVFAVLDQDGNGNLTLDEMILSVQAISKERKTIFRSLRDVDSAIGKLHHVLLAVVVLIIIIIFIGMLAPSVSAVLATLGTSLLAMSFIFSPTAQEILGSCIFLFVKHPFDVGDLVILPTNDGPTKVTVTEISLLFTVFTYLATGLQTQAPNFQLNTMWVDNITRSGYMTTAFTLQLGMPETTLEDIEQLKDQLDAFLEENHRDFLPDPYFNVVDMPDLDRISLYISITFKSNQHDGTTYGMLRTRIYQFLAQCIHSIPLHVPQREDSLSRTGLPVVMMSNDVEDAENRGRRPANLPPREPFGFQARKPPVFELEEPSQVDLTAQAPQQNVTDSSMLSPTGEGARTSGVQRLDSMASRTSSMVHRVKTHGRRKKE